MIWPTGSSSGKRVLATVAPSRQTFSADQHVAGGEVRPGGERPVADRDVVLVAALDRGVPVLVAGDDLGPARGPPGVMRATVGTCASDGLGVVEGQGRRGARAARATPPPPRPKLPGRDVDDVRALALDLLVDGGARAASRARSWR